MRVYDIIVQLDSDAEYMIELPFTPKGFCPLAQGCSPKGAATLGGCCEQRFLPQRGCALAALALAQPRWGKNCPDISTLRVGRRGRPTLG